MSQVGYGLRSRRGGFDRPRLHTHVGRPTPTSQMKHLDIVATLPSQPLKQRGKLGEPANVGYSPSHPEHTPVLGLKLPRHSHVDGLN
jgi:hypothetical protein